MVTNTKLVRVNAKRLPATLEVTRQDLEIMAVGKSHHWPFRLVGVAPVPMQPVFLNDWWLVPLSEDTSAIPDRALQRVRTLYEAGISPKAFIVAHKAEKQLAPPAGTRIISPAEYWTKRVIEQSVDALKVAGRVTAVVAPLVLSALGTGLLFTVVAAGALLADPVLCAITDDDVWIAIDEWMA